MSWGIRVPVRAGWKPPGTVRKYCPRSYQIFARSGESCALILRGGGYERPPRQMAASACQPSRPVETGGDASRKLNASRCEKCESADQSVYS